MKPFSTALAALFDAQQFVSADLYTFVLPGGGQALLTSADTNLTYNDIAYLSGAPRIQRSAISQKTGLQVSTVKIEVYPTANDLIGGAPWLEALQRGFFDGAAVTISRAFAPSWGQAITGAIVMMAGRVADSKFGRSKAEIDVNSWTELLSNQMPRTYYQSQCNNTLGDARCGVNLAAWGEVGTVTYVGNASTIAVSIEAPAGFFTYGTLLMESGTCAGERRPVAYSSEPSLVGNEIVLQVPLSKPPAIGDAVLVTAGCDKTMNTCRFKFGNLPRFTGFPFIPAPEMAT